MLANWSEHAGPYLTAVMPLLLQQLAESIDELNSGIPDVMELAAAALSSPNLHREFDEPIGPRLPGLPSAQHAGRYQLGTRFRLQRQSDATCQLAEFISLRMHDPPSADELEPLLTLFRLQCSVFAGTAERAASLDKADGLRILESYVASW